MNKPGYHGGLSLLALCNSSAISCDLTVSISIHTSVDIDMSVSIHTYAHTYAYAHAQVSAADMLPSSGEQTSERGIGLTVRSQPFKQWFHGRARFFVI